MAVAQMAKILIVSHRSEASELLEALQQVGICHILNAQQARVSQDSPELVSQIEQPKDIDQLLGRLDKSIEFLKKFAKSSKGLAAALAPRTVIEENTYKTVVSDEQMLEIIEQAEQIKAETEELENKGEHIAVTLEHLEPWRNLETHVEEIGPLETATSLAGMIPTQNMEQVLQDTAELGSAIQPVASTGNRDACIIVVVNENLAEVQKLLRQADFEQVTFEGMTGNVRELIKSNSEELEQLQQQLIKQHQEAVRLAENLLKLQILFDHYTNLLSREKTRADAPATEQTVVLEGWVKKNNFSRLEKVVSKFEASSLHRLEPAEDEDVPVEIENKNIIRPFEVITRLYGMPRYFEVDPTVFLAPFFAIFFGLCLTDAGYGLIILAISVYFIKKMQGDKKLMYMLAICSVATIVAGALMGGWFGDAIQKFIPALAPAREKMMWFDPMKYPLRFFALSLILGYIQIMAGLLIAFIYDLKRKLYIAALCDKLTWLIMLNSIFAFALAKTGELPIELSSLFGYTAMLSAAVIFLFSHREGNWGTRLGMGFYNLFSALFYIGDVLSYLRLMALGLVTAGLAMAVNQIAELAYELPFVGLILSILILVGGHLFNLGINALGAFVHTLRLQYAEFFPKFFSGGGLPFEPLGKSYKHIYIKRT
ncbi:V-type ATP synthase subunit I [Planctomycetota bacterium]